MYVYTHTLCIYIYIYIYITYDFIYIYIYTHTTIYEHSCQEVGAGMRPTAARAASAWSRAASALLTS